MHTVRKIPSSKSILGMLFRMHSLLPRPSPLIRQCSSTAPATDHRCHHCGQRFHKELDMKKHVLRRHSKAPSEPPRPTPVHRPLTPTKPPQPSQPPVQPVVHPAKPQPTADFECALCLQHFPTQKDIDDHRKTLSHQSAALRLLGEEARVLLEATDGGQSALMAEILALHRECRGVETEIEKLVASPAESERPQQASEPSTVDAMGLSRHIPQGYPFRFTYKASAAEASLLGPQKPAEAAIHPDAPQRKRFYAFVNEAQLVGTVNMELMCAFRTADPSSKFSVLVRRPVLASRVQQEVGNATKDGRRIEEETFVVECRGEKWCTFARESIRPGVVVAINGRLSMRPMFHESDGSYTYNAVVEVTPADGSVHVVLSENMLG